MANIKPTQPTCRGSHAAMLEAANVNIAEAANAERFGKWKRTPSESKRNAYEFIVNARRLRVTYQLQSVLPQ